MVRTSPTCGENRPAPIASGGHSGHERCRQYRYRAKSFCFTAGGFRHRGAIALGPPGQSAGLGTAGSYGSKAEADNHATALNDVSAFGNALQLVTAYVAGTTEYACYTGDDR